MQKDKSIAKHLDETLFLYQSAPANHLEALVRRLNRMRADTTKEKVVSRGYQRELVVCVCLRCFFLQDSSCLTQCVINAVSDRDTVSFCVMLQHEMMSRELAFHL